MYVRAAKNREEVWLLDHIESMELDETAFRSRDYVVAVDEDTNAKAGFGRIRIHKRDRPVCEITSVGVLPAWRHQGVGAHVIERLLGHAEDEGFERVYALTERPAYLAQFGFERVPVEDLPPPLGSRLERKREDVAPEAVPSAIDVADFVMPGRLRERFKHARERDVEDRDPAPEDAAEEFGIDPDSATYKYDTE